MTWYLIVEADGSIRQVSSLAGESRAKRTIHPMERRGNLDTEVPDLDRGTWSDNMPAIIPSLCEHVDHIREQKQQALLTPGTAKAMIYAQKAREWEAWQRVVLGRGDCPGADVLLARFPAGSAEAAASDQSLDDIMAAIGAAVDRTNAGIYEIEAAAVLAKRRIRDCTDAAAAGAVLIEMGWNKL